MTAGVAIDHIFSIGIALLGGVFWTLFGFQWVFFLGILIAALTFLVASRISPHRLPLKDGAPLPLRAKEG